MISLDFELRWGVRDHCPPGAPYERNLHGARDVIPRILELFVQAGVAATWAVVGFLFARDRMHREQHRPSLLPAYRDLHLDPYLEETGEDEASDPLHYAASLIASIVETPQQEVATHTFSHYLCGEPGASLESFRADLESAVSIAAEWGITLRSIVFPRNQHEPRFDACLREFGITAYRGNPRARMWQFSDARESARPAKRAARLCDTYLPITGDGSVGWEEIVEPSSLANVRASFILGPFIPALRHLEKLRSARLRAAMRSAARRGRIIHLWWHPHNFGAHPEESLRMLGGLLQEFSRCRDLYGMQSLSMAGVAEQASIGATSVERGRKAATQPG